MNATLQFREHGNSLIETLVALLILAIVTVRVLQLFGGAARATTAAGDWAALTSAAQSRLETLTVRAGDGAGAGVERRVLDPTGRTLIVRWETRAWTDGESLGGVPADGLRFITVTATLADGRAGGHRSLTLCALRAAGGGGAP